MRVHLVVLKMNIETNWLFKISLGTFHKLFTLSFNPRNRNEMLYQACLFLRSNINATVLRIERIWKNLHETKTVLHVKTQYEVTTVILLHLYQVTFIPNLRRANELIAFTVLVYYSMILSKQYVSTEQNECTHMYTQLYRHNWNKVNCFIFQFSEIVSRSFIWDINHPDVHKHIVARCHLSLCRDTSHSGEFVKIC